jgi:predicted nucleic acid-binding protein
MEGPVVLVTSVVIKWYRQGEVLARHALAVRDAYLMGQIRVSVPSLLAYGLANVFRDNRDLSTAQVQEAVQSVLDMRFEWVLPSTAVLLRAVEMARVFDATVYDSVFAALAESVGATFVSADERLCRRLASLDHVHVLGEVAYVKRQTLGYQKPSSTNRHLEIVSAVACQ